MGSRAPPGTLARNPRGPLPRRPSYTDKTPLSKQLSAAPAGRLHGGVTSLFASMEGGGVKTITTHTRGSYQEADPAAAEAVPAADEPQTTNAAKENPPAQPLL